ncbi:MAG: DUF2309 family protein, partial [Proteobacteria bacterium]|nr:DUF2309 family protein [Pseudomonadota bacterium]
CAVYASRGGQTWRVPAGQTLFASWRDAASHDRSLDLSGLTGFRAGVRALPHDPVEASVEMLLNLDITERERRAYLYRLLGGLYGWAAHFRRVAWERDHSDSGMVRDVLAIRLCMDAAVARLAPGAGRDERWFPARPVEDETVRVALLEAMEDGTARSYLRRILPPPAATGTRPATQAVFCIDVRSEVLRRHLERCDDLIETRGFAGFFGVALRWDDGRSASSRCPVLLRPGVSLSSADRASSSGASGLHAALHASPGAGFAYMETIGLGYAARLLTDAVAAAWLAGRPRREEQVDLKLGPGGCSGGMTVGDRVDIADSMLRGMGFGHSFARIVLLCGHAGCSANNPHAASLDCGACGGHGGALNARIAAAILNDSDVRSSSRTAGGASLATPTSFPPCTTRRRTRCGCSTSRRCLPLTGATSTTFGRTSSPHPRPPEPSVPARWASTRPPTARCRRRSRDVRGTGPKCARSGPSHGMPSSSPPGARGPAASISRAGRSSTNTTSRSILTARCCARYCRRQSSSPPGSTCNTSHRPSTTTSSVRGTRRCTTASARSAWCLATAATLRLQVVVECSRDSISQALSSLPAVNELVDNGWVRLLRLDPAGATVERFVPGSGWEPA